MNKLCLATGKLTVQARGYWFTLGGEKGSFGYYPHLKDANGFPIFPDTQIHGNLLMSAKWLQNIGVGILKAPEENTGYHELADMIPDIFGGKGSQSSALLKLTDLELTQASKETWNTGFFRVKTRITIDDEAGTVEKHMLADHELSFLDDKSLEAGIWLGYFTSEAKLTQAVKLISDAASFLSGFGGFRSRGYGTGKIKVQWDHE